MDYSKNSDSRRSLFRFLKLTLVGAGILLLFLLLALALSWKSLTEWDRHASPWNHLPRRTVWAVHAHDLSVLGKEVIRDKGFRSLFPSRMVMACEYLGFLHKAAAPNTLVAGASARDPDAVFVIMQPPAWLRLLLKWSKGERGDVKEAGASEDQPGVFYVERDGWLIASYSREAVREVLDGWSEKEFPLGPGSGRTDAHAYAAIREEGNAASTPPPPTRTASHFTLADPFAAAVRTAAKTERVVAVRALLTPGIGEWHISGDATDQGVWNTEDSLEKSLTEMSGAAPALSPPPGRDAAAFLLIGESAREKLIGYMDAMSTNLKASGLHPSCPLAARWLQEDWLEKTGNGWIFTAGKAALEEKDPPYPPLPVLTLGWKVKEGVPGETAAEAFGKGLDDTMKSVRSPGGQLALQNLRNTVAHHWDGRNGGRLAVPPVALNGARPAWRFCEYKRSWTGWFSTDPAGLPEDGGVKAAILDTIPAPEPEKISLGGGWLFRDAFIDEIANVAADRLKMLENARLGEKWAASAANSVQIIQTLGECFPEGSFTGNLDTNEGKLVFRARVPQGAPSGK